MKGAESKLISQITENYSGLNKTTVDSMSLSCSNKRSPPVTFQVLHGIISQNIRDPPSSLFLPCHFHLMDVIFKVRKEKKAAGILVIVFAVTKSLVERVKTNPYQVLTGQSKMLHI